MGRGSMSLYVEDGSGVGRRFVMKCDECGVQVSAPTIHERETERARLRWSTAGRDLCPPCQTGEWSVASGDEGDTRSP